MTSKHRSFILLIFFYQCKCILKCSHVRTLISTAGKSYMYAKQEDHRS